MLVGRYEIIRELGGGGFAITFLAKDCLQPSQPLCVVKQLRPERTEPRIVEFFETEATVLEKLGKYSQIPQLLAHFRENNNLYIVQEFIEGHDLKAEIIPGKQLSESYVTKLLQDVLQVLSFVHNQQVIHRDIKPENLMRQHRDGKIFLIDFGAVKELSTLIVNVEGKVTSTVIVGTPGYMPNEQKNGKPIFASDIYALGVMLIQALTGVSAVDFEEDAKTGEILWRHQARVSKHLANVLSKMVRRHYSLRYANATEVLQDLSKKLSPPPTRPQQSVNWSRRRVIQTVGLMGASFSFAIGVEKLLLNNAKRKALPSNSSIPANNIPVPSPNETPALPTKSVNTKELALKTFQFEVMKVDKQGNITIISPGQAIYFIEDLGNGNTLEMVEIPGGHFLMGSPVGEKQRNPNEGPQHPMTIKVFFMGKFTVTQEQYQAVMGINPSYFQGANRPVEQVSWNDAVKFCQKLSLMTNKNYRLPSEAEWEYACRAGTTTPFYFGETITTEIANYNGSYIYGSAPPGENRQETMDVGSLPANAFGLYEMHGNVWEWCQDKYHNDYRGMPADGSAWVSGNNNPCLLRGGSWLTQSSVCRSSARLDGGNSDVAFYDFGFRVVCTPG
ncbi:MAG: bifunctional serine/threonine-protein kinase/formylglycine-generating enzyme family protein [Nostoc sp. CmiVER01]|uniref:bifunctional serine/threonine-protein kinase/formylglycine-generating enzyme family protein n=1 Tax=Nostoc sp. CmiVER01 TaxID=3075384 RepID=UPI002AD2CB3B|nr:bifunctional serine/threonine-protein kinase/formylglycine-generating enzyme family protein [Nostoc sp. CmiVER01]MDZ8122498.1 bifunctional serine/threonine-protein kinase/formylglycine-generating enzyme family protein [Nostoc sp. CmiVER01]